MFRYTVVHITDSTDHRNIIVVKWWHYIRDKRTISRCIQDIRWTLSLGLMRRMKSTKRLFVCADTCRDVSSLVT